VVPVSYLEAIVRKLGENFDLSQVREMTLEANPSSLTTDKLKGWKDLGFGRVSLGVQSFHTDELELLGRVHSVDSARTALEVLSSDSGFRFSADLIFGLPGQTPERFIASLKSLLEYNPAHVSFYGLTVEEGTEFARRQALGTLKLPDGEIYRSLYTQGVALLQEHGLERYEVSNFARPGQECQHNQGYWNGIPYLAFGPGAHGFDGVRRWMNPHDLEDYLRWGEKGFPDSERVWDDLDDEARLVEAVSLGLRQREGFSTEDAEGRFGAHWPDSVISRWEKPGYLERAQDRLRLRGEGWLVLDEICADLLAKVRRDRAHTSPVQLI